MRPLALVVAILGIAGCNISAAGSWQKQGADDATIARDMSACRDVARGEASQRNPYQLGSPVPFGMPSVQQSDALSRTTYEAERLEACMQGRGYSRR